MKYSQFQLEHHGNTQKLIFQLISIICVTSYIFRSYYKEDITKNALTAQSSGRNIPYFQQRPDDRSQKHIYDV